MERDSENHTRWKHKWRWHNRGNVCYKIATEWAGEEDWLRARNMKSTLDDKYQFVTFVIDRMKRSIVHRNNKGKDIGKKVKDKTPRDLGPADTTIHTRVGGPDVQVCGDSDVACKWINGQYSLGQKTLHSWWKEKKPSPISKIDDLCETHSQRTQSGEHGSRHLQEFGDMESG